MHQALGKQLNEKELLIFFDLWLCAQPYFILFIIIIIIIVFLGPHPRQMEVPRLGVKSELQPLVYTTATATPDP